MAFDFGKIGEIVGNVMDSDEIDIGRSVPITLPDGSSGVTDPKVPIYKNVKCHLSFNSTDNPDPVSVGSVPIIMSITINCPVTVDLQNADYIIARKLAADGTVLEEYQGTIGAPATSQSRQSAVMEMRQAV